MNYQYCIPKEELSSALKRKVYEDKSENEIKDEIKSIYPLKLYSFQDRKDCYCFFLNDSITVNDVISIYDEFNIIAKRDETDWQHIEQHRNALKQMNTLKEVIEYATSETIDFWHFDLPDYVYSEPHKLFGKRIMINTYVSGIAFYIGCWKTFSESNIESFNIFTDLLRYRLKDSILAESMSVFLTA